MKTYECDRCGAIAADGYGLCAPCLAWLDAYMGRVSIAQVDADAADAFRDSEAADAAGREQLDLMRKDRFGPTFETLAKAHERLWQTLAEED